MVRASALPPVDSALDERCSVYVCWRVGSGIQPEYKPGFCACIAAVARRRAGKRRKVFMTRHYKVFLIQAGFERPRVSEKSRIFRAKVQCTIRLSM
jgi:hypothetical protein